MGSTRRYPILLFIGDIFILFISLWITLLVRYLELPGRDIILNHLLPFSILFIVWLLVFFIAGMYEKRLTILRHRLPITILEAQIANSIIAVLFFYFIPYFGITPKTNLFIYLVVSLVLILLWRLYGTVILGTPRQQNAILIASGTEMKELYTEVNAHPRYGLSFISYIDLNRADTVDFQEEILKRIYSENITAIILDFNYEKINPLLPSLYSLIFSNILFIDMHQVYEDVFDRIPLSLIKYSWFLENISLSPKTSYDILKRFMDIVIGLVAGMLSLLVYPFVILAIKLDDRGSVFISQQRVGKNGKLIKAYKFRTMKRNEVNLANGKDNVVTRVGAFLRKTRIDEFPQIWSVIKGDMSLIGPRPELPSGVALYEKEIPYYGIRHLIKPGLSGWAQLYHDNHPHHGLSVEQTKEKLSYDLFYLKNRSFILDMKIALKTLKKLLSIAGK